MNILITNDDGIEGEGLKVLVSALTEKGHAITVVAPSENNSAVSHKLTMRSAVKIQKRSENEYAVGGTPADCVLIALAYLKLKPDLILSGINTGVNMGSDVLYSGTVAGALEGAQNRIPSIALSQYLHRSNTAEETSAALLRASRIIAEKLSFWATLSKTTGAVNINFPPCEPLGFRICRQTHTQYNTQYRLEEDGLHMEFHPPKPAKEGDVPNLKAGYVTLTPLKVDLTDDSALEAWEKL